MVVSTKILPSNVKIDFKHLVFADTYGITIKSMFYNTFLMFFALYSVSYNPLEIRISRQYQFSSLHDIICFLQRNKYINATKVSSKNTTNGKIEH